MDELHIYLGDSVYAEYNPETNLVALYLNNGDGPKNTIYLEPQVRVALARWLENNDLN